MMKMMMTMITTMVMTLISISAVIGNSTALPLLSSSMNTTSSFPNNSNRQLAWAEEEAVCSAEEMAQAQQNYFAVDVRTCFQGQVQWDPDATLVANFRAVTGFWYTASNIDITQFFGAVVYLASHSNSNGENCRYFDYCITDTFLPILGSYAYDCSNVYCGPNAIRDCSGATQTVACTNGLVSSPEIPPIGLVDCRKQRQTHQDEEGCSKCTVDEDDDGTFSFTCVPPCPACSLLDGTACFQTSITHHFNLGNIGRWYCQTSDSSGDEFCFYVVAGTLVSDLNNDGQPTFAWSECGATWNGEVCSSCTICGLKDDAWPLVTLDCSNIPAVVNSVFDQCSNIATGVFQELEESCASTTTTTSQNPAVSANPVTQNPEVGTGVVSGGGSTQQDPTGTIGNYGSENALSSAGSSLDLTFILLSASIVLTIMLNYIVL
mmetsp:Transcript_27258/g.54503  ORF Transcript_27258/g.54503 Transcript_27258/m.54503 type:complete len:434 (+) Transcript_27258:13-1314(+)